MTMSWLLRQLNKLPQPWRLISGLALIAILIAAVLGLFSQVSSCGYDKARKEHEEQSKAWATERVKLLANAEAKEKQVAELELQVTAFRAAAEQGKKVDDTLADKIDQVSKEAADEALVTDAATDCWIRGDRTCLKLKSLKPPIVIDCDAYKRKLCSD